MEEEDGGEGEPSGDAAHCGCGQEGLQSMELGRSLVGRNRCM